MLDWLRSLNDSSPNLESLRDHFLGMLQDGRHTFDAASNALVGGTRSEAVREDLYLTDQRINQAEQQLRREILVHGLVHGASTFPGLLVLMSVAKDAERIGDYAKNILELAESGAHLGGEEEVAALVEAKDRVSQLLARAHGLFSKPSDAEARSFLDDADELQKTCETHMDRLVRAESPNLAAPALAWRYMKRVTSHTGNIVTSLVVPVDKLDFWPGKPQIEQ